MEELAEKITASKRMSPTVVANNRRIRNEERRRWFNIEVLTPGGHVFTFDAHRAHIESSGMLAILAWEIHANGGIYSVEVGNFAPGQWVVARRVPKEPFANDRLHRRRP